MKDYIRFGLASLPQSITLSRVLEATENNQQAREHIVVKNAEKLLNVHI